MRRPIQVPKVGRPGITDLPYPASRFDLTLTPDFETAAAAEEEDRLRAAKLRRRAMLLMRKEARALSAVADAIDPAETPYSTSPASARFMREARLRIIGQLWRLIDDQPRSSRSIQASVAAFTVIPANSSVPLGMLHLFNVVLWMAAFRQHLIRSAALLGIKPEGFLFACLHGAYDPATQTYPMHLHGVATRDMIAVLEGLRQLRKYRPAQPCDDSDRANVPVWISRGSLTNMPAPLTYVMKSYWPVRETRLDADGIRRAVSGKVQQIRGPAYSEYLQFLDAWRLEDVTLMMGLRATREALVSR